MRWAPTLKIWMTPFASVAMLEKFALLKIAFCRAPAFKTAWVWTASRLNSADSFVLLMAVRMSPQLRRVLIPAVHITPSPKRQLKETSPEGLVGGNLAAANLEIFPREGVASSAG